jgi:DNA-binding beta-propeller fold protein YncE
VLSAAAVPAGATGTSPEATIPTDNGPFGLAFSPNSAQAYVANSYAADIQVVDTGPHAPAVISTVHLTPGVGPDQVAVSPDQKSIYVTEYLGGLLRSIDVTTSPPTVGPAVPTGPNPAGLAITDDGHLAIVANFDSNTVSVVGLPIVPGEQATTVVVGDGPYAVAARPGTNQVYVGESGELVVMDAAATPPTVVATVPLTPGCCAGTIAFSPHGNRAYAITGAYGTGSVAVVDTTAKPPKVVGSIAVANPFDVAVSPDGQYLYVISNGSTLEVFDLSGRPPRLVTSYAVGQDALSVRIAPNGRSSYVTNHYSNTISVIPVPQE